MPDDGLFQGAFGGLVMLIVGLTGGIATGKSVVTGYLRELGAYIVDWDVIARAVVEPGLPAWQDITQYFGKEIVQPDGRIDRSKLGEVVFGDEAKRRKLNSFTHPRIMEEAEMQARAVLDTDVDAVVIHDVPLLFEAGLDKMVDKTVLVYATEENQVRRLMDRDSMSRESAIERLNTQMPVTDKVRQADFVIDNNGSIEQTREQVRRLYRELVALASTPA